MLSVAEADRLVTQHLGETPRATHSRFVAYLMRRLAAQFAADADVWEIVGLCHDLDFFETRDDSARHGLMTVQWLGDRISPEARRAIEAHDHRTGVGAESLLADMLKLADVVAVIDAKPGRSELLRLASEGSLQPLRMSLSDRPYLCDMLQQYVRGHGLPLAQIAAIVSAAPQQHEFGRVDENP